jgi:hypothetical protein
VKRAALGLTALVAGCTVGGDEKSIDGSRVDDVVLQQRDVGASYRPTYVRNLGGHPRAEVRYRRALSRRAPAAVMITSTAEVFRSRETAETHLDAARDRVERAPEWQPIAEPGLGEESFAATAVKSGTRHYRVFWRAANAAASVQVEAAEDELPLADVLELARRQDDRMAAASQ